MAGEAASMLVLRIQVDGLIALEKTAQPTPVVVGAETINLLAAVSAEVESLL